MKLLNYWTSAARSNKTSGCERSELSFSSHMKGVVVIQNGAKNRMNHEPSVNGDMVDLSNRFFLGKLIQVL